MRDDALTDQWTDFSVAVTVGRTLVYDDTSNIFRTTSIMIQYLFTKFLINFETRYLQIMSSVILCACVIFRVNSFAIEAQEFHGRRFMTEKLIKKQYEDSKLQEKKERKERK